MDASSWRFLLGKTKVDGVIGGPPCQGFSRIGKNDRSDPRRTLVGHFFRTVNLLLPTFFVMENVEGLLDSGNREALDLAINTLPESYTVLAPMVVDASKFGAPTRRKRVIVIGYQKSNMDPVLEKDIMSIQVPPTNVRQAIRDLPHPTEGKQGENEYGWAKYATGNVSTYARKMRRTPPKGLGTPLACDMLANNRVSGCFVTKHSESVVERFRRTRPGKTEPISRYPRLDWLGLCPTLRAGTGSDRGNFQAMRPLHPEQPRVITVREAARLQGFPDWFLFHKTKHHSFRMIGNSVSPIMAEKMLGIIKERFFSNTEPRTHQARATIE